MTNRPQYLTKSRFKLALECPTKLFYTGKRTEYADQNDENEFLKALAKGGYQVGELAKFKYCKDPIGQEITIHELGDAALAVTQSKLLAEESSVVAEGAFKYENLYVRADIVVRSGNRIKLIEVKSKSWDSKTRFTINDGTPASSWKAYLYDLAFQTYVLRKSMPGFSIEPYLLLVNKEATADMDGLNQHFRVKELSNGRYEVVMNDGLTSDQLGSIDILKEINLQSEIETLFNIDVDVPGIPEEAKSFESFIQWCSNLYEHDHRHFSTISNACKHCSFKSKGNDGLKCGFTECWSNKEWSIVGRVNAEQLHNDRLVTELWLGHGGSSVSKKLYSNNVPFLNLVAPETIMADNPTSKSYPGMSPYERRCHQLNSVKANSQDYIFLKDAFLEEFNSWHWPLHMIDFETSVTAIPFFKGVHAYETIAFQFSHHIMHEDGRVEHFNDHLSFESGTYPNINFVRALKESLEAMPGSVFRYSNHENTVLRHLRQDILDLKPADTDELLAFIDDITQIKENNKLIQEGPRNMIDLAEVVRSYYYSPHAKGSNSIKQILPAILNDCKELKDLYSKPGRYGQGLPMHSRNFIDHVWLQEEFGFDPYKTLPSIGDISDDLPSDIFDDFDQLGDGSAAMTAYNKLQFAHMSDSDRQTIAKALLNYCELDTLAMVIIIQGLLKLEERNSYE